MVNGRREGLPAAQKNCRGNRANAELLQNGWLEAEERLSRFSYCFCSSFLVFWFFGLLLAVSFYLVFQPFFALSH